MRRSVASRRSSSSRAISACANGSKATSASGGPRQIASASRSLVAASPGTSPVLYAEIGDPDQVAEALDAGVRGFISKGAGYAVRQTTLPESAS